MPEPRAGTAHDRVQPIRAPTSPDADLHPAWRAMIRFCRDLGHGEIACIKIHDGVPICAEVVTKKIRWS